MEITQVHTLNLTGVLKQTKMIIFSRYTHFITFSLLFLPLSFSLIITPTLSRHLSDQPFTYDNSNGHKQLLTSYLIYTLIVHVIALCAIGTITYTTQHAFFGEPVNLLDTLKSLIFSFVHLALTAIAAYVLIVLIIICFLLFVVAVLVLAPRLGFIIDYNSVYLVWFSAFMGAVLIAIVVYFHVNWSLAFVVVVVESKWGFAPLKRSSYLVKGMRLVSLLVMLCFGVLGAFIMGICSSSVDVIALRMLGSFFVTMILVGITAANTVLYNYCKALHGELAIEVAEPDECVHDYVDLASDGEKLPHVVSVVIT